MSAIDLPTLAEGVVDWETVFNAPGSGLVSRIDQARSAEDLQKAMKLILKTLFSREGDEERRAVFTNLVNEILTHANKPGKSPAAIMAEVKVRVVQILNSIKDDRLKRARKAIAAKKRKAEREALSHGETSPTGKLGYHDRQPDDVHIKISSTPAPPESSTEKPTEEPPEEAAQEIPTEAESEAVESSETDAVSTSDEDEPATGDFDEWLSSSPASKAVAEYEDTGGAKRKMPEEFFTDVIVSSILGNMASVRGNLTDGSSPTGKLPFILSPAFAVRFEQVLRDHVLPDFTESSYFNISQMTSKPRTKWLSVLTDTFADKTQGLMLWERWQIAWRNATTERDLPEPPEEDPNKQGWRGIFKRLLGDDDQLIPDEEMTQEEWEEAVEETRQENLRARATWESLCAESNDFEPPSDKDNALLMSMFQSLDDLETHISSFRRFAKSTETAGTEFDSYHQGKDLDLALLAACYRYPDELLAGEKTMVATFVAGLDRNRCEAVLPLCCRFLGAFMGNRFTQN